MGPYNTKEGHLGFLSKVAFVDGKTVGDLRNFPKTLRVIACIRDRRNDLNVWSHLYEAKGVFPKLRMAEMGISD